MRLCSAGAVPLLAWIQITVAIDQLAALVKKVPQAVENMTIEQQPAECGCGHRGHFDVTKTLVAANIRVRSIVIAW